MSILLRNILLSVSLTLAFCYSNAQARISLSVNPGRINKDEFATLKILIENPVNLQQVIPPPLKDFIIASGPNEESGMSSVNGAVTRYASLVYILKPARTGTINIDAAAIRIAGKLYKTNSTSLVVDNKTSGKSRSGAAAGPRFPVFDPFAEETPAPGFNDYIFHKGDVIAEKVNRNMILRLEVDKTSCFVGEPVVATYKLYTRLKSESKLTENPSFNGFSVIDLTGNDNTAYTREKLNGREYNVYIIRKAQLYPLQAGNIELESAALENNIQFIKDEYINKRNADVFDMFDDFSQATVPAEGIINQSVTLKSKPVVIEVKPLPEKNKPDDFSGAVGHFSMEAGMQKQGFAENETGKLTIKISGEGNLQLLNAPQVIWPEHTEPFDPKVLEDLNKSLVPVNGYKQFEYGFSSDIPGDYKIPSIHFSYFDPKSADYKTISSEAISFTVTKSSGNVTTRSVAFQNETVSGINKIFYNRWWIIVFIAVMVISGLLLWLKKEKKKNVAEAAATILPPEQPIPAPMPVKQENPLVKSGACLEQADCPEFYSLLNAELKTFLSDKFGIQPNEFNIKNIGMVMDNRHISNETILQLQKLLHEIEWQLYTPHEKNEKMREMYDRAQDIIHLVNTYQVIHL